ncbi:MAG: RDD family protein [Pirellulaceae bacterium]|nr:RDD family protein [Pirellulaceae bacterium]
MLHNPQRKIDCVVHVVTPENIEFEYTVAGPFQRLPPFLVDFALRASVFVLVIFLTALVGLPLGINSSATTVVATLAFFVLSWFYGTVMETQFNGRTVGKMVFGLRVISADGRPINGSQAALRNLLRLCDFMPPLTLTLLVPDAPPLNLIPTCMVGLVAMTLTGRMQRIGDLAAGTMVVWEVRRGYNAHLHPEDARAYTLSELIPPTFQVSRTLARAVALYMERRMFLSIQRREEIAGNLAGPLLKQFEMRDDTSADLLLCAIYVRIYQSEDQRLAKINAARRKGELPSAGELDGAARKLLHPVTPVSPPSLSPPQPVSHFVNPYDDRQDVVMAEIIPEITPEPVQVTDSSSNNAASPKAGHNVNYVDNFVDSYVVDKPGTDTTDRLRGPQP